MSEYLATQLKLANSLRDTIYKSKKKEITRIGLLLFIEETEFVVKSLPVTYFYQTFREKHNINST